MAAADLAVLIVIGIAINAKLRDDPDRRYEFRIAVSRRGKKAATVSMSLTAPLAFWHIFPLPIRDRFDSVLSQFRPEQAQLMIKNDRSHSSPDEDLNSLGKLVLIVGRINPNGI